MRFVSPPNPQREKYARMLGLLEFGAYDPSELCRDLAPEAASRAARMIDRFAEEGFLDKKNGVYVLSASGAFWGNNMAAALLEAVIGAKDNKEKSYA
jgi:coproporphyrinogen III oxidase-like Fe-S oxidoreductase